MSGHLFFTTTFSLSIHTWHKDVDAALVSLILILVQTDVFSGVCCSSTVHSHRGNEQASLVIRLLLVKGDGTFPEHFCLAATCQSKHGVKEHHHGLVPGPDYRSKHGLCYLGLTSWSGHTYNYYISPISRKLGQTSVPWLDCSTTLKMSYQSKCITTSASLCTNKVSTAYSKRNG